MTNLDLDIHDTHNSLTIGVADASTYDPAVTIANPSLEVTPPGGFSKVTLPFTPKAVNIINSNLAGITFSCDYDNLRELPDGIWTLKYSIKPNLTTFVSKYYLRTSLIECRIQNMLVKNLLDEGDPTKKKMQLDNILAVRLLVDGAIAAANKGETQTAMDFYTKASKVLDNMNSKCDHCGTMYSM